MLLHLVVARDAQVDAALADEGRDVGCGQEDQGDGQVLDEGYVEAALAAELDVGAFEEVEGGLEEAALCTPRLADGQEWERDREVTHSWARRRGDGLLDFVGGLAARPCLRWSGRDIESNERLEVLRHDASRWTNWLTRSMAGNDSYGIQLNKSRLLVGSTVRCEKPVYSEREKSCRWN